MVTWLGSAGSGAAHSAMLRRRRSTNRDMTVSNTCRVVRATATLPAVLEHNVRERESVFFLFGCLQPPSFGRCGCGKCFAAAQRPTIKSLEVNLQLNERAVLFDGWNRRRQPSKMGVCNTGRALGGGW